MRQPRGSQRKAVAVSAEEEEEDRPVDRTVLPESCDDEQPPRPQRKIGNAKPPTDSKQRRSSTLVTPASGKSSNKTSPAKPKARTKIESKSTAKHDSRSHAKPIYSFFNAATQRQQSSRPSASPEKPVNSQEPIEIIHDNSDDETFSSVAFSADSSTALAVRKRKVQESRELGNDDSSLPPPATQKFRKTSDGGRAPSFGISNEDQRPWTEQFAPADLSELAVHKRKVADVRQWLETAFTGRRQRVLVLKGPAGAGKSTTVHLLAKAVASEVVEWKNPGGAELVAEGAESTTVQFEEFIGRIGRSTGLTLFSSDVNEPVRVQDMSMEGSPPSPHKRQLLLMEEFPNTSSRTSGILQSFRSVISQYVASPPVTNALPTPIVMIITETLLSTNTAAADSFTAHRLLGPELMTNPYINTIEFNSVAPTILTKALDLIVVKEARKTGRRRTPGPQVLKHLVEIGDIRSAVSSLEFLCSHSDHPDAWSNKIVFTKPKKKAPDAPLTKVEEDALGLISSRESCLGIFHAVGRVVYNNRVEPARGESIVHPPPWLPQHRRAKVPENDVDSLIDELGTDASTFVAALHENYALSCSSASAEEALNSLSNCIDSISDADLLSADRWPFGTRAFSGTATDGLRQDEICFQVAVRGLLFHLPSPVHRSSLGTGSRAHAHRMFYPSSLKIWKQKEEVAEMLELLTAQVQGGNLHPERTPAERVSTAKVGVEGWKRNNAFEHANRPVDDEANAEAPGTVGLRKTEMLLERLPYMYHIWSADPRPARPSVVALEQIASVTQIRGQEHLGGEDDDEDLGESEDAAALLERWAVDRPDAEVPPHQEISKGRSNGKRRPKTDAGRLSGLAERSVEKLVLDDDDIVD